MRQQLARSLEHIFQQAGEVLELDNNQLTKLHNRILQDRIEPGVFSRYFSLVFAIEANDYAQAQRLVDSLYDFAVKPVEFRVVPYTLEALGEDYERYPKLTFATFSDANPMSSPGDALFASHKQKIIEALDILRKVDASIAEEVDALVSQVIVARHNSQEKTTRGFGGVSSLMVWGGIFINAENYYSLHQVIEFLVHEVTHCVLFGYSVDEPLVLNPPQELYPSPLRNDPRPMDGVYHATIVCARVALLKQQLLTSKYTEPGLRDQLQKSAEDNRSRFLSGLDFIQQHGQLSAPGSDLLFKAESSIKQSF